MTCDAHLRTWPSYSSQKTSAKIWLGLVEPFKSYHGNKQKSVGEEPPCDAHFQTRMSYSTQKSCVKIWFGLVEIRGMLIFRGRGQKPPIRGLHVTCDAHFRISSRYSSQKSCVKIWFRLVDPFKLSCPQKKINK